MSLGLPRFLFLLILILGTTPRRSDAQFEDWCVADEQTPDEELERAIEWACQNGADCAMIQANQPCYLPNTSANHASFAFNSYFQKMKHKGGNCYFNSAAMLTALDPSYGSCKFVVLP